MDGSMLHAKDPSLTNHGSLWLDISFTMDIFMLLFALKTFLQQINPSTKSPWQKFLYHYRKKTALGGISHFTIIISNTEQPWPSSV
jgi:hypothetical protein